MHPLAQLAATVAGWIGGYLRAKAKTVVFDKLADGAQSLTRTVIRWVTGKDADDSEAGLELELMQDGGTLLSSIYAALLQHQDADELAEWRRERDSARSSALFESLVRTRIPPTTTTRSWAREVAAATGRTAAEVLSARFPGLYPITGK